ncbi:hypothetical protein TSUD_189530 [Trifolium subterraneum]|uniref:Uncharacterized protein n=1 Tax=Trifolium subterraneum TaxID=3900 RepID=A0A2Z6LRS7_TRISU|nr:hypothetical protein TSUD_189530 [Trifolium subterraneum]
MTNGIVRGTIFFIKFGNGWSNFAEETSSDFLRVLLSHDLPDEYESTTTRFAARACSSKGV